MSGSTAADKKAKCSLQRIDYLVISIIPEYLGAGLLQYYSKFSQHFGLRHYIVTGNTLDYSVNLSPLAQWFFLLLWLSGYIFFGSGYIFFGSMDLFSSA
jgi:hypothetical protein